MAILACSAMLAAAAAAQTGSTPVPGVFNGITLALAQPPQPVSSATGVVQGNPGPRILYYWIVTNALIGSSAPAGPFIVPLAPNTLSASNSVSLSWSAAPGAITYDVLRTTSPAAPVGACNCAVATAIAGTTTSDQSNTLGAYTVAQFDPNTLAWTLSNQSAGAGVSKLSLSVAGQQKWSIDSTGVQTYVGLNAKTIEQVRYADQFPGADIGAQINAAYAALPSTGGKVVVPCGAYSFATPIVFGVVGKLATVEGQGHCTALTFTPTSGNAILIDTNDGDGQHGRAYGVANLTLAGAGGTSVGVMVGQANGAEGARLANLRVSGFGTNIEINSPNSWDTEIDHVYSGSPVAYALLVPASVVNLEDITLTDFTSEAPAGLACAVNLAAGNNSVNFYSSHFDDSQVCANGQVRLFESHFENPGNHVSGYFLVNSGNATISGVDFSQDFGVAPGSALSAFIKNTGTLAINGLFTSSSPSLPYVIDQSAGTSTTTTHLSVDLNLPGAFGAANWINVGTSGSNYWLQIPENRILGAPTFDGLVITNGTSVNLNSQASIVFNGGGTTWTGYGDAGGNLQFFRAGGGAFIVQPGLLGTLNLQMPAGSVTLASPSANGTIAETNQLPLTATTGSIGGAALAAGACTTGTVAVTGATTGMVASTSPAADPGAGFDWQALVGPAGTVTVRLCNRTTGSLTPTAETYIVRVIQ